MASKFFKTLISRQIDLFIGTFAEDSNSFFKEENQRLIHPGEYGIYKERCFRTLLQSILEKEYAVSEGVVISSCDDHITTQCDVVVYDSSTMPLTDGGLGKFFPVENTYAIGEIKSNLSKDKFEAALRKLAKAKKIMDDRKTRIDGVYSDIIHFDTIPTFLVCNKLQFDINKIDFEKVYSGIDRRYWHNLILSLEDGEITYQLVVRDLPDIIAKIYEDEIIKKQDDIPLHQYPQYIFKGIDQIYNCPVKFIAATETDKYHHIIMFLAALKQAIEVETRYKFDSLLYLGLAFETD